MSPEVQFLAFSQVNWQAYIDLVQEIFGVSPTRCLDSERISIESTSAFVVSLHRLLEGSTTLTNFNVLKTIQASFIIKSDFKTILLAQQHTDLKFISVEGDDIFTVVSGDLYEWRLAILAGCGESVPKKVRLLFNKIFILFNNTGLNILWKNCPRLKQQDGTITIKANYD